MEQLAAIFGQLVEDLTSIWNRTQLAPLYRVFVRPSCVLEDLRRHPTFSGWGMRHSGLFDNVTTYASSAYPSAFYHAANSSGPCNVRNNYWREVGLGRWHWEHCSVSQPPLLTFRSPDVILEEDADTNGS